MDASKRKAIWDARFDADYRHRYFLALKQRLSKKLRNLSIAIALLSCGPIVGVLWQSGLSQYLVWLGVLSGVIGIYIGASGLPRALAAALQAATVWGQTATEYATLWVRCESGEDVWKEHERLERDMNWIDAVATEHLDVQNQSLIEASYSGAEAAIGAT